jgi:hypothetical protein
MTGAQQIWYEYVAHQQHVPVLLKVLPYTNGYYSLIKQQDLHDEESRGENKREW